MELNDKIFIAGHNGLVGSAILRQLKIRGFKNLLIRSHDDLELTNQALVLDFFKNEKPDYVILAAAKVGGIHANSTYPADFIYDNIMIQTNIIHAAYKYKVKQLLYLGSTCIYPKLADQPIKEDALLTGLLEPTNEPYAIAKISGIKLCESYNMQYSTDFRSVMPTNLYGINDNFHPENSHVIPALMRRFHEAKIKNSPEVIIWGDGRALREFLFVDDMAQASIFVLELDKKIFHNHISPMLSHINIGTGSDISILELAKTMKKVVGFKGELQFDPSKPNGTLKKLVDSSKLKSMGWTHKVGLLEGLEKTYKWYLNEIR
jgi:GDP-L-fucose synthase|tara:strand:+ start:23 stop:979 length:957 start_codon:yes stop_codon:yes gene_type:complete